MKGNKTHPNTRELRVFREKSLNSHLERIKSDGSWPQWLNASGELHIARICRELGKMEEGEEPLDSTFFRGANWGVCYKNAFNRWVRARLDAEPIASELNMLAQSVVLTPAGPSWFRDLNLPGDVIEFINRTLTECKQLHARIAVLEKQLIAKDRKIIEQQMQFDAITEIYHAKDEHYKLSIRSLSYDD